jgi:hypothetical protein
MTQRIVERDATTIDLMIKAPTMMKMQFHLIGRSDDITNLETRDFRSHNKFKDFCLQTKVSWSKNVMEERDCPDQILLGSANPGFCVLVALSCWLESGMTDNHGDSLYLFGHSADPDNEPQRINMVGTNVHLQRHGATHNSNSWQHRLEVHWVLTV